MKFSETKVVDLKLVDAKGSFFDIIGFLTSLGVVLALQFAFKLVGFTGAESKSKQKDA